MVTKSTFAARSRGSARRRSCAWTRAPSKIFRNGAPSTSRARATCSPIAPRVGDYLVLKASVELHVPDLVDELGREKRALLLVVLGQDEAAELGRDPLLGD